MFLVETSSVQVIFYIWYAIQKKHDKNVLVFCKTFIKSRKKFRREKKGGAGSREPFNKIYVNPEKKRSDRDLWNSLGLIVFRSF